MSQNCALFTASQVADRWQVKVDGVLARIASGALIAINIAPDGAKRATWRITFDAIANYERSRSTVAPPPAETRRSRQPKHSGRKYF